MDFPTECWFCVIFFTGLLNWCLHRGMLSGFGGRRNNGKMDSQKDPWTECVEGKLPAVFCYNLGMTLEIGSEVTKKGKSLQGSQLSLLEGVAYG